MFWEKAPSLNLGKSYAVYIGILDSASFQLYGDTLAKVISCPDNTSKMQRS